MADVPQRSARSLELEDIRRDLAALQGMMDDMLARLAMIELASAPRRLPGSPFRIPRANWVPDQLSALVRRLDQVERQIGVGSPEPNVPESSESHTGFPAQKRPRGL